MPIYLPNTPGADGADGQSAVDAWAAAGAPNYIDPIPDTVVLGEEYGVYADTYVVFGSAYFEYSTLTATYGPHLDNIYYNYYLPESQLTTPTPTCPILIFNVEGYTYSLIADFVFDYDGQFNPLPTTVLDADVITGGNLTFNPTPNNLKTSNIAAISIPNLGDFFVDKYSMMNTYTLGPVKEYNEAAYRASLAGAKGTDGADGASAYQTWLDNGAPGSSNNPMVLNVTDGPVGSVRTYSAWGDGYLDGTTLTAGTHSGNSYQVYFDDQSTSNIFVYDTTSSKYVYVDIPGSEFYVSVAVTQSGTYDATNYTPVVTNATPVLDIVSNTYVVDKSTFTAPFTVDLLDTSESAFLTSLQGSDGVDAVLPTDVATMDNLLWQDLRIPLTSAKVAGTNDPTFKVFRKNAGDTSIGTFAWAFAYNQGHSIYCEAQLPHGVYKGTGAEIRPHVHFSHIIAAPSGTTGIVWGLEYTVANAVNEPDRTFGATTTIYTPTYTIPADSQYRHMIAPFPAINAEGLRDSAVLLCRLFRAVDETGDDFNEDIYGISFDIHYQAHGDGSIAEFGDGD